MPVQLEEQRKEVWSSGVPFYPNFKYWRINNKYYDLTPFMDKHPGGRQVLELARDRFEDSTYAFEAHHHNQPKVRSMLSKYEVKDVIPPEGDFPHFMPADSFYNVLRARVHEHLKTVGGSGPTQQCVNLFWFLIVSYFVLMSVICYTNSTFNIVSAMVTIVWGIVSGLMASYGHNWIHQPKYRFWAVLGLDLPGLSSENWLREHTLQHHMYTNTPQDPHWFGTAPWLMTDPLTPRNWLHRNVMPYINWFIFWFGVLGNSVTHLIQIVSGWEPLHYGFLCKPVTLALLTYNIGFYQALMTMFVQYGIVSTWFYTIAIMNHNTEDGWDIDARNNAQDWGEAQLIACADIGVGLTFYESARYLWLNYHTVHHLFPHTCMSKHPGIQTILVETCKDFNIRYECNDFTSLYLEMCENFGLARHEGKYTFNDFKLRLGDPTKQSKVNDPNTKKNE